MGIYEKLLEIQQELKAPKNQVNQYGGFNYRSCEDILEAVKPILAKTKTVLIISDTMVDVGGRVYVCAMVELVDTETGEKITGQAMAREAETAKGIADSQLTGATSSYARKYALNGLFAIDDNKDADTIEPSQEPAVDWVAEFWKATHSKGWNKADVIEKIPSVTKIKSRADMVAAGEKYKKMLEAKDVK